MAEIHANIDIAKLERVISQLIKKSNLHYTRRVASKRVTSDGIHLHDLAPGQRSSEETSQRWRAVEGSVFDLTELEMELKTYRTNYDVFNHFANQRVSLI